MARTATRHQIEWAAAGLCRAAARCDVTLPTEYARRVAATGLATQPELGVTPLGAGIVIHTQPPTGRDLPIVIGYADARGQWYRDGTRHTPATTADSATSNMEPEVAL